MHRNANRHAGLPSWCLLISLISALVLQVAAAVAATNLVVNGGFEQGTNGWGPDQLRRKGVTLRTEGGNTWLAISNYATVNQTIRIDPEWTVLHVAMRMRLTNVELGKEGWHDARLAMSFADQDGKRLTPWPAVLHGEGSSPWTQHERHFKIPAGAAGLDLSPSMFGASGTAEFDDITVTVTGTRSGGSGDLALPAGAEDNGDLAKAWRQNSNTRESVCLNGLWRFMPIGGAKEPLSPPPSNHGWGWFKVPGVWPKSAEGAQQILLPSGSDDTDLAKLDQAWYKRPLTIPTNWAGRRVLLEFTMLQTHARVLIDGQAAGELFFPGGLLDITRLATPGRHELTVLVTARPIDRESSVFMAPDRIISSKATVRCKGLTGDVFLRSEPSANAIADVHVMTSTRQGTIAFDTALEHLGSGKHTLEARIYDGSNVVKTFTGAAFDVSALRNGRITFSNAWTDARLWDLHTPRNLYTAVVAVRDAHGTMVDESLPVRFGFREFWIDGRDFYLNGSRVHLRCIHLTNPTSEPDQASAEGSRNTCRRMQEYGFNAFITSLYSFAPGEASYLDGLYNAADEEGVIGSFTLPHAKDFGWKLNTPAQLKRYREQCEWLVRRAQNHPSVVLYSMTHNSTGYKGDQNPLWMDGIYKPDDEWARTNPSKLNYRKQATIAADIAKEFDPTRPVYHHQSGNLGDLYTVNIYLNWAPMQERSDWLEHWATTGVKPMFFVEWGLPHVSSFSSYRGPQFIWRNPALQQIWDSEFAAPYLGGRAYQMTPTKVKSMAWEEDLWAKGQPFYWSSLIQYFRSQDENYTDIQALFASDNWRSHRAWGNSAMLPWDQENLWRIPKGAGQRVAVKEPYKNLQQPGIAPDRVAMVEHQWIYSRDISNIKPSALGEAFLRWNMPLCAYIGGDKPFTDKGHNFSIGEAVRKNLVLLNDTRQPVTCRYKWSLEGTGAQIGGTSKIEPGGIVLRPVTLELPPLAPGRHLLKATFDFEPGGRQEDSFAIDVVGGAKLPLSQAENATARGDARPPARIALYDPKGDTSRMLKDLGVSFSVFSAGQQADCDVLIIGRQALTTNGPLPGFDRLGSGLKLLVFEQDADVLTTRLGFRINVHGLRQVFARVPSHPALAGLREENLRNWQGAATIVPPHLDIRSVDENDPKWTWCGFENTRVWRAGNRGSVATVLIEKPDHGNFLPLVDGGFDLQYAPLLEYREGQGRAIFCQLDVTGRTQEDPAARLLCANLLRYLEAVKPAETRATTVAGDERVQSLIRQLGITTLQAPAVGPGAGRSLLILGPGGKAPANLRAQIEAGLAVLCLGLNEKEIQAALPGVINGITAPTVSMLLDKSAPPAFAGISDADLHWRTRPTIAALEASAPDLNPALRAIQLGKGQVVLCQAAPWMFDDVKHPYLRTTYRRNVFLVSRLLHNLGATTSLPFTGGGSRYTQTPQADDDPYRYYRW